MYSLQTTILMFKNCLGLKFSSRENQIKSYVGLVMKLHNKKTEIMFFSFWNKM